MAYFNQCLPRVLNIRDGSGCSITRATLQAMTPDEFAALGDQEDLQRVYANATEAKMRGVNQRFIDELLLGRLKYYGDKVTKINLGGPQSIIQPFITMKQKTVVNSAYFNIESGADNNGYRWNVVVVNNGLFSQQSLPRIDRYFVPGNYVVIQFVATSGASYSTYMKVISSTDATVGNTAKATVVLEPNVTSAAFAAYTNPQKAPYQPTGGLIMAGTNAISDYEAWCNVGAVDNNNNLIHFWQQTARKAHVVSQEYLKAIEAKHANEFFKVFDTLPYAEQIRQQDIRFTREWWTSVFWGQPINEFQDVNNWQGSNKLPQVTDIDDNSCVLEYKAASEGIEYQLNRCSRVVDYAGQPINFDALAETLYELKRNRQETSSTGDVVEEVVMQADRITAGKIKSLFANWYKTKYNIQYTQEVGKGANEKFASTSGLTVNSYDFDDASVRLTVISDPFFNDLRGAAPSAHKSASTYALLLDYSDIDIGIVKSASRTNEYPNPGDIPSDYRCVLARNVKTYRLYSQTFTTVVQRPERSLILKGFDVDTCPVLSGSSCSLYEG
jgi:hypothetical protein